MGQTSWFKVLPSSRAFSAHVILHLWNMQTHLPWVQIITIRSFLTMTLVPHLFSGLSGIMPGYINCRSCTCCLMGFKSLGHKSCPTDSLKLVSKLKGEYLRLLTVWMLQLDELPFSILVNQWTLDDAVLCFSNIRTNPATLLSPGYVLIFPLFSPQM